MSCDCLKRVKKPKYLFVKRVIKKMFGNLVAPDSLDQMMVDVNMGCEGIPIRMNPGLVQSPDGTWWRIAVSDEGVLSAVEIDENCDDVIVL